MAATTPVTPTSGSWRPKTGKLPRQPVPGYNFEVYIQMVPLSFSKISGMEMSVETEAIVEGGNNRFTRSLLKPVTGERILTLERGMVGVFDTPVFLAMIAGRFAVGQRLNIPIALVIRNQAGKVTKIYSINGATVRKWSISPLDAASGNILIETFELTYETLEDQGMLAMAGNMLGI